MKLNVVGEFFGDSGYASHTRNLCNALVKEGIDIAISCNKPDNWMRQVSDIELKMLQSTAENSDYMMLITLPTTAPVYWNTSNVIQYVVWEGDKVPKSWIPILLDNRIKYIFTPSKHTRDAILNTVKDEYAFSDIKFYDKIHVIPHGVNLDVFYPNKKKEDNRFTFLFDGGWPAGSKDRKGLSFLLKAYGEEFKKDENVRLIAKVNMAYGMSQEILNKNMSELKYVNKDVPKVDFMLQNIPFNELVNIYNKADVFVISSLAESFHIGGIQAMACGLPVVATDFGGQTDYVTDKNGWLLTKGKMREVDWDLMYESVSWKLPSIVELRQTLRYIYEHQQDLKVLSDEALETAKQFTWANSARKIKEIIKINTT